MTIRVLLVDDHPLVLDGISAILSWDDEILVVGAERDGHSALAVARADAPDVILLDVGLGSESGLDLIEPLQRAAPLARIVMLTIADDAYSVQEALRRGARGYVLKDAPREEIRAAVHRTAAGFAYVDAQVSDYLVRDCRVANRGRASGDGQAALSGRQQEILRMVAMGLTNDAIASLLDIKAETVKTHLSRAFSRLGARDRASAVAISMRRDLL